LFGGISNTSTTICGRLVPLVEVRKPATGCSGHIITYDWCADCDCGGGPVLQDMQIMMPCTALNPNWACGLCPVPNPPGVTPASCPAPCPSTTSSSSSSGACTNKILYPPLTGEATAITVDGVEITATHSGSVGTYNGHWLACFDIVFFPGAIQLGEASNIEGDRSFIYTLNFSAPVTRVIIALGATGPAANENFAFTAAGSALTVSSVDSCYSTISSAQILSGEGALIISERPGYGTAVMQGGGGGLFAITSPTEFTALTITGDGGNGGSLFGVVELCPTSSSSSSSRSSTSSNPSCIATAPTAITFSGQTQTGAPLNNFGPGDSALVTIYTASATYAKSVNTQWKFYVNYGTPSTRYEITSGDFSAAPTMPMFNLTSEQLLSVIGLSFETAPDGAYSFEMCAEATNCANLYDNDCAVNRVIVRVTGNGAGSSNSSNIQTSSSSSAAVGSSSSYSSSSSLISSSRSSSSSVSQTTNDRVLYFVGANTINGTDWGTLTNWRYGSASGPLPTALPGSTDSVVLLYTVEKNTSAGTPCVNNLTFLAPSDAFGLEIAVDVAGTATFSGRAFINENTSVVPTRIGSITGNTTFNGFAQNFGVVNGDAVFNGGSVHFGEINGAAIFNGTSIAIADSIVRCNATFNDNSMRQPTAQIYGTVTCNTTATCETTSAGACNSTAIPPCGAAFTMPLRTLPAGCVDARGCPPVYTATARTKTLPETCPTCPDGWDYHDGQCFQSLGSYASVEDCGYAILAAKKANERLVVASNDGLYYGVLLHFESYLCHRRCENGQCLIDSCAQIAAEQFT
jgi:hypothetical protein